MATDVKISKALYHQQNQYSNKNQEEIFSLISESRHVPEVDLTFNYWFGKCKDMFRKGPINIAEKKRVRLRIQRLETAEQKKLESYIRPKELNDLKVKEAVSVLC
ncbi:hypothetical protein ACTXT7_013782 [Hymenolepis weldensis]